MIRKIISGGQTGADRAALDAAIATSIPHGGWCPRGRKAEDGPIDLRYQLTETSGESYLARTERNVKSSDGTVTFTLNGLTGGSARTADFARRHRKLFLHIQLGGLTDETAVEMAADFISEHQIHVLNVAGSSESSEPGIYARVFSVISLLCRQGS